MHKSVKVIGSTGNEYCVTFSDETGTLKASCTCQAGEFGTLCKHIMEFVQHDEEVREELKNYGLLGVYEEYTEKLAEADRMKREASKIKKKFQRLLMR